MGNVSPECIHSRLLSYLINGSRFPFSNPGLEMAACWRNITDYFRSTSGNRVNNIPGFWLCGILPADSDIGNSFHYFMDGRTEIYNEGR